MPRGCAFFTVRLIGLEILTAERPCIGVVALDDRVEHTEIISAVTGVAGVETVYHICADFDRRHSGEIPLCIDLVRRKIKEF